MADGGRSASGMWVGGRPRGNDPHSRYLADGPQTQHLNWLNVQFDFTNKQIHATAVWRFDRAGNAWLDAKGFLIHRVYDYVTNRDIAFAQGEEGTFIGEGLNFAVPASRKVAISYSTSKDPKVCKGLQFFDAAHTDDRIAPLVFSMGEMILARTFLPCPDTPGTRFTYEATILQPSENVMVRMAAWERKVPRSQRGKIVRFGMSHPIPSYLVAFAVGHFDRVEIDKTTAVYAEPSVAHRGAEVFKDAPEYLAMARKLFGKYRWRRLDLFLPPWTFAYGGMENLCLVFLSQTTLHPSGVDVLPHEEGHFWFGNVVTNAHWCDFWLNEGWTVWAELKLTKAKLGKQQMLLKLELLRQSYVRAAEHFKDRPQLTKLCPDLNGIDPDAVYSTVPYYKGVMFLMLLEELVGERTFMKFARQYIRDFAFKSVTTEQFLDYFENAFPGVLERADAKAWVYGEGIPANAPKFSSELVTEAKNRALERRFPEGTWCNAQKVIYLETLARTDPSELSVNNVLLLGHDLVNHPDPEVRCAYFVVAIKSGYRLPEMYEELSKFLRTTGRMKFLMPIFKALVKTPHGFAWARDLYAEIGSTYHPQACSVLDEEVFVPAAKALGLAA